MIYCDDGGTYEVVRKVCEWNGDSETGQRAQPRLVASSSAGANLIVDRRALAYAVNANVHVLLREGSRTARKLRVLRRSRTLKLRTAINDVTALLGHANGHARLFSSATSGLNLRPDSAWARA